MPDWRITSGDKDVDPRWNVTLGNCDQTHAQSVVAQLEAEVQAPSGLTLTELDAPVAPRSWWKKVTRRA